ncbi:MAG: glycosyltransferase family 4 protein [Betaproteobacteria bacterium]
MKILHTEASRGWGGQEIRILTEAAGMIARGHVVEVACPPDARIFAEAPRFGVTARPLPIARKNPGGLMAMRRYLRGNSFDVVNTHSSTDSWLVALASLGWSAPPLVRTRHISAPVADNRATRWLYCRASAHVVTTGGALREQLIRDSGLAPERVTSVPTGIDPARYPATSSDRRRRARAALGLPASVPIVGIVATLRSWKGHRYLIEALGDLPDRETRLAIVGDGPQRVALEAQARDSGLQERIIFAGNCDDVAPWLHSFDVFALPSYANEGVPQALLQAMFTGLGCVTTDAGAIPEIAMDGTTALIVAREDAGALARALQRLLEDAPLATALGRAARERMLARHSLDTMLDRMEAVFAQTQYRAGVR